MSKILERSEKKIKELQAKVEAERKKVTLKKNKVIAKELVTLGKLVKESGIDSLDHDTLLGAFIDIGKKSKDENQIDKWNELSKRNNKKTLPSQLILSFEKEIDESVKKELKNMKFYWNRFRNEWYGKGFESEMHSNFKKYSIKVEAVVE